MPSDETTATNDADATPTVVPPGFKLARSDTGNWNLFDAKGDGITRGFATKAAAIETAWGIHRERNPVDAEFDEVSPNPAAPKAERPPAFLDAASWAFAALSLLPKDVEMDVRLGVVTVRAFSDGLSQYLRVIGNSPESNGHGSAAEFHHAAGLLYAAGNILAKREVAPEGQL